MGVEIERKFLVSGFGWADGSPGARMTQGYLSLDPDRTVRVRLAGEEAWLTIKGRSKGLARAEFEYPIPAAEARELLALCTGSVIDKTRHRVEHAGHTWEIDVFHGDNDGLVVAEVEMEAEDTQVELPEWVGAEVSDDTRYLNSRLVQCPFKDWAC
ncbi:CYTH domain-containing protein [Luteolibacter sp. LG18]|uniref:CYTH domain-containing protein n=1 Tax=Luteolibacter sp. LG18 TaxID=2819286 RepID=UPI002B324A21|nr:CYTH domain-containing protein [Luteolibacter sp. LG18]